MEAGHGRDEVHQSTDGHLSISSIRKGEHDISQSASATTDDQPRKRSHSILHWMQKAFTNVTSHQEQSSSRQRSATLTQHSRPSPPRRSPPPISQALIKHGRPRASTMDSVGSTSKKMPRTKKIIADTDPQAQQSPSIFQYAFGR